MFDLKIKIPAYYDKLFNIFYNYWTNMVLINNRYQYTTHFPAMYIFFKKIIIFYLFFQLNYSQKLSSKIGEELHLTNPSKIMPWIAASSGLTIPAKTSFLKEASRVCMPYCPPACIMELI